MIFLGYVNVVPGAGGGGEKKEGTRQAGNTGY